MKVRFAIRLTVLLVCSSLALFGGSIIDLYHMSYTSLQGDVVVASSYVNTTTVLPPGVTYDPYPPNSSMFLIGGGTVNASVQWDNAASSAVWATSVGILNPTAYWITNGGSCTGPAGNVCTSPDLETALNLTEANLNQFVASGSGVTNGSAIVWDNVSIASGDTISPLAVNFVGNDYDPYLDFAFFSAKNKTTGDTYVTKLSGLDQVGDIGVSGWFGFDFPVFTSGNYTLGLGVVNVGPFTTIAMDSNGGLLYNSGTAQSPVMSTVACADYPTCTQPYDPYPVTANVFDTVNNPESTWGDSALLVDPAPEPATLLLAGSALLMGAFLARRKRS